MDGNPLPQRNKPNPKGNGPPQALKIKFGFSTGCCANNCQANVDSVAQLLKIWLAHWIGLSLNSQTPVKWRFMSF